MTDLLELAARCEAATGPDYALDEAIAISALGWKRADYQRGGRTIQAWDNGEYLQERSPDHFTRSLDAAMTLVPEGHDFAIGHGIETELGGSPTNYAWCGKGEGDLIFAESCALALCAAALRAIAHQMRIKGND